MVHEPALSIIYLVLSCYILYYIVSGRYATSRNPKCAFILLSSFLAISFLHLFRFIFMLHCLPIPKIAAGIWQIFLTALPGMLYIPAKMDRTRVFNEGLVIAFPFITLIVTIFCHSVFLSGIICYALFFLFLVFPGYILMKKVCNGFVFYNDETFIVLTIFPIVVCSYINGLRIVYAKRYIEEKFGVKGYKYHFTIDDLAVICGFGSKRNFIRNFKLTEGVTPMQYIRKKEVSQTGN